MILHEKHREFTVKYFAEYIQRSDVTTEKTFFEYPILTPMQQYSHCLNANLPMLRTVRNS